MARIRKPLKRPTRFPLTGDGQKRVAKALTALQAAMDLPFTEAERQRASLEAVLAQLAAIPCTECEPELASRHDALVIRKLQLERAIAGAPPPTRQDLARKRALDEAVMLARAAVRHVVGNRLAGLTTRIADTMLPFYRTPERAHAAASKCDMIEDARAYVERGGDGSGDNPASRFRSLLESLQRGDEFAGWSWKTE